MKREEIVTALSMKMVNIAMSPNQVVFAVTMQDIIAELARTLGEKALHMNPSDLLDVRDEVRIAIDYGLDIRDYIQPGIDVWNVKSQ